MTSSCALPRIDISHATRLVNELFGLDGLLQALDGDRDLNYLVVTQAGRFVFKIANVVESRERLYAQHQVMEHLNQCGVFQQQALSLESVHGSVIETVKGEDGSTHYCRVLPYFEGRIFATINPHTPELLFALGQKLGRMDRAMQDCPDIDVADPMLWQIMQAPGTLKPLKPLLASDEHRGLIEYFESLFEERVSSISSRLRHSLIHNDANDHNILVAGDDCWDQDVVSIFDFGDMCRSWLVADPAIAAAYAMLDKVHPLEVAVSIIRGYHSTLRLNEDEVAALFPLIGMRLCLSVSICAYQRSIEPDNAYLSVSEESAWALLERLRDIPADFANYVFRDACGLIPVPQSQVIIDWLQSRQGSFAPVLDFDKESMLALDLSVSSSLIESIDEARDHRLLTTKIVRAIEDANCSAGIGAYDEYRLVYGGDAFVDYDGHMRSLHLGVDIFMPEHSNVYAPLASTVFATANHEQAFDYGGTLILQHQVPQPDGSHVSFYTLYGHLSPESISHLVAGSQINAGDCIARLGHRGENGGWPPHLHFEVITDLLEETDSFIGVGSHVFRDTWLSLCLDPNLILGLPATVAADKLTEQAILSTRQKHINPSLSLSYRHPIHVLRGSMQYLYDASGRAYLDAVNNVPHVGHCHPRVTAAAGSQAAVLNTNTRYLYAQMSEYSERLLANFPESLSVCYLVNSGSEANDLALRLARQYTRRHDIVILDHAYHGNLSTLIDISPYKHDGKGGRGRPDHVHTADIPDTYRGAFKTNDPDAAIKYARLVQEACESAAKNGGAAAFMSETILGCGGQVVLPDGYLAAAYTHARNAGAVCIADEVQVGFGRTGSHFWGFESQQVVPDIVTLGKPVGNGHPLAAVVTTREIADSFNNGMEYFNTFGGNPVSCAVGIAVLEVVEEDDLQANALKVGNYLLTGLHALKKRFPIIGDVRGLGLFIGVELVTDPVSLAPAAKQAAYIAERMKQGGILISTDGPMHNVLKIKPPMCFSLDNAQSLLDLLTSVLNEDFAR